MDETLIREVLTSMGSTKLRRTGDNTISTCPFAPWTHATGEDRRPSFTVQVNGSGTSKWNCFGEGTLVLTPTGYAEIQDLRPGMKILDECGVTQTVKRTHCREAMVGEMAQIKVHGLREQINVTLDHEILVIKAHRCPKGQMKVCRSSCGQVHSPRHNCTTRFFETYTPEWVCVRDVMNGEPFYMKSVIPKLRGLGVGSEKAFLLGYYCAEGSVYASQLSLASNIDERPRIEPLVDELMELAFGGGVRKQKTLLQKGGRGCVYRYWMNHYVRDLFSKVGQDALCKRIPFELFSSVDEVQAFVNGQYMGDGCVVRTQKHIATSCRGLVYQLRAALLMLGHNSAIHRMQVTEGRRFSSKPYFEVIWSPQDKVHNKSGDFMHGGFWNNCVASPSQYTGRVYDLEVTGSHTYNADGMVVHNCYACKCAGKKSRGLFYKFKELSGQWDEGLFLKVKMMEGDDPSERIKRLKSWDEQGRRNSGASIDGGWYVDGYEAKFDIENFAEILDQVPQYAIDRGITIEQAKQWKIGFHKQFNRLFFALRDETGKMVGWSGRAIFDEQEPKYLHAQYMRRDKYLYGEAHLDPTKRYGFIMEGFMDVLNLNRLGLSNVLAVMGTGASDLHIEKLCRWFDDICIFPHNDWREFSDDQQREMRAAGKTPPGEDMAFGYRDKLLAKGKRVVIGPCVPGKKDPGDWTVDDLKWVLGCLQKQREGRV